MQKAVFVNQIGKPLALGERAVPKPGKEEILIKIHSTMLLPHDTYSRDLGLFIAENLPYVLGTNITGTVKAVGQDVTGYEVGDRVFGIGNPLSKLPDFAGLQQYALFDARGTAQIPEHVSFEDASCFPVNVVTSAAALFLPIGLGFAAPFPDGELDKTLDLSSNANRAIVIIGGGSNVGKIAIQFARMAKVGKVITVASAKNRAHLLELGATHVIDRHLSNEVIVAEVRKVLDDGNEGALSVYDCVSWDFTLTVSIVSLTKPSVVACLHPVEKCAEQAKDKGVPARVEFIRGTLEFLGSLSTKLWRILPKWIEEGHLWIPNYRVVDGLDIVAIEEGLDSYRDGSSVVPLIIRPNH
ncbi:chaperonin 10-like protein [Leptodontidium sp. 2 PMI_412]|nr:chaperonin 10-like protein [Leptodontidium sp. 2 PMI_412]